MKTIKVTDVVTLVITDVEPGHIIAEGVVLEKRYVGETDKSFGGYFLDVPDGNSIFVENRGTIQVFAKVSEEMVDAIKDAIAVVKNMR